MSDRPNRARAVLALVREKVPTMPGMAASLERAERRRARLARDAVKRRRARWRRDNARKRGTKPIRRGLLRMNAEVRLLTVAERAAYEASSPAVRLLIREQKSDDVRRIDKHGAAIPSVPLSTVDARHHRGRRVLDGSAPNG